MGSISSDPARFFYAKKSTSRQKPDKGILTGLNEKPVWNPLYSKYNHVFEFLASFET